jgi:hypothetical protein
MARPSWMPRSVAARIAAVAATAVVVLAIIAVVLAVGRAHTLGTATNTADLSADAGAAGSSPKPAESAGVLGTEASSPANSPGNPAAKAADATAARTPAAPGKGGSAVSPLPDAPVPAGQGWTLSNPKVLSKGDTAQTRQGTLTQGRVIAADATSEDGHKARFTITLTQFVPSTNAPGGTSSGRHYLQGSWRLVPSGLVTQARNPLGSFRGALRAESPEDLISGKHDMKALVELVGSYAVGGRAARQGEYKGTAEFDGQLVIPSVSPPASQ